MISIHLQKMQFFGYHGLYEVEKEKGNRFELEVTLEADLPGEVKTLEDTIDYVRVYELITKRMEVPTALLETIAQELVASIHLLDKRITTIDLTIKKLTAPIPGFNGVVAVTCKKVFV